MTSHAAAGHILQLLCYNYYVIPLLGTTKCKVNPIADHEDPDEE
jgi:hypothetical protein